MHSPEGPQAGREPAKGANPVSPSRETQKGSLIARLEQSYPDRVIPWGGLKAILKPGEGYSSAWRIAAIWRGHIPRQSTWNRPRQQVISDVTRRFPDKLLPYGEAQALAVKHGVSRQRVSQLLALNGFHIGRRSTREDHYACRRCRDCDAIPDGQRQFCAEHAVVPVSCSSCGKITILPRAEVIRRARQDERKARREGEPRRQKNSNGGMFFCHKTCRKERGLAFMAEHPELSLTAVAETMGVTRNAVVLWKKSVASP